MNTPSHLLINAALRKGLRSRVVIPGGPFLWGSVAPDLPLYLLSIGGLIYYPAVYGWTREQAARHMFDTLYFNDPFWIAAHNTLHSPTMLLLLLAALWPARARGIKGSTTLWWFLVGCLVHTAVDIPCHVDDGPLLFFPFNWTIRYHSPVSYWDPRYYGTQFAVFELTLDLVLLLYLLLPRLRRRLAVVLRRDAA
jgi:hypothetical protein